MKTALLRNMLISAALLAVFGGLGTALVMFTFEATKERIEASEKANLLRNLNNIIPPESHDNNLLDHQLLVPASSKLGQTVPTTIYQAWQGGHPVAVAFPIISNEGYSGEIKLLIAIKANGHIYGVRVISHKETPGLGDKIEIAKNNWILGFDDKHLIESVTAPWKVKKDGGSFDQFTGATITPRAVVNAVFKALDYFNHNHNKLFLDQAKYDKLYGKTEQQRKPYGKY
ncbi:MAG: electron transport complex subunit RsxG [gamma proteobacterium symbiont of Bathyaustriella thionipta]|nr:electron transport complex subunit RsxG [gamma proteobacterium symbiont of Bathyaustriella thionipta]MCU7949107.1 electron transport complex subunit RsxG [gamma proteobacterium symbiont of Bathyaustriella thionipta]MCU7952803.1 electron transport complex subunit RsxG [gamma proteobacterium symbiont of Bathyaustriella thionipta]MCU7955694.1 electron transport complex subunit RsxG [gamma proteobacterium symbiont of Bathyaustriella thionipta]MCU7968008.1 electron transport complex subunit RsxG 